MAFGGAVTPTVHDKYARFHAYCFEGDGAFVRGWERVSSAKQTSDEEKLKAKLFYYSKRFEPVCLEEYTEWLTVRNSVHSTDDRKNVSEINLAETDQLSSMARQTKGDNSSSQQEPISSTETCSAVKEDVCLGTTQEHAKGSNPSAQADSNGAIEKEISMNFQELVECLQEGRPIPGIKKVNAAPTFSDPTPSSLNRCRKPWEKDE